MKTPFIIKPMIGFAIFIAAAVSANAAVPEVKAVPGEFIVKMMPSVNVKNLSTFSAQLNSESAEVVSEDGNLILVKRNMLETADFSLQALKNNEMVEYVEPNYIFEALNMPNDPLLPELWGLINNGQNVGAMGAGTPDVDIDAEKAWAMTTGSEDVIVAVIDTGVDHTIPDLAPNMWINEAEANGKEGVDDDGNGYVDDIYGYDFANNDGDPMDDHGHGSHCSGTIGARGNDEVGIVGVAWNVKIMGVKFLSGSGSGTLANAVKSIDYARENGANIMSNSWGGGPRTEALKEAIQRANDAGITFVAAAGNHKADNDAQPTYPANYEVENVISVAAIDNKGALASFSCYGKETVHVAAPGVEILSTTPDGFKSWRGTSMATPHVSGVAALLLAQEPNLTPAEIRERIIFSARPKASLREKVASNGIVNAFHALTNTPAPIDQMDPYYWPKESASFETEHPYADNTTVTFEIKKEGAAFISVHFAKFETEGGYDFVSFKDADGNEVDRWSGSKDDSFSPSVPGDTMIIEFTSDSNVNKYGFVIDAIAYREATDLD